MHFIAPGGEILTNEKNLETYRSGNLKINSLDFEVKELKIMEDLGIIALVIKLEGTYQDEPLKPDTDTYDFGKDFRKG